ncbi:MAG: bifunctional UDP-N-acetylmuramoyl-tripeptide:D-alanyl-D-alanine ligase/alanine racemase [Owenweeksia sp.]
MHYTVSEIKKIIPAKGVLCAPDTIIHNYLYDSRRMRFVEHTLFIAIRGRQHNGHDYITDLYEKGIRNFLVEHVPPQLEGKANFLQVKNSLAAFQQLAIHTRSRSEATIIAITGSNGKTIVKEWLYQVLKERYSITKTPKSYNSQLGVPLSVLKLNGNEDYAIFEAGISEPGEMQNLQKIVRPQWGLFTNIGSAHQEYFENLPQKVNEKLQLFKDVKGLVYCYDHKEVAAAIDHFDFDTEPDIWSWSLKGGKASIAFQLDPITQEVQFDWKGQTHHIPFPFKDEASVENALHVLTMALALGERVEDMALKLPLLEPVSMRLELKSGRWNTILVNDAYNADLESLKIGLEFFTQQLQGRALGLVLSDMLETGDDRGELYRKVADILNQFALEKVFTVGTESSVLSEYYTGVHEHYDSTAEFLKHINSENFQGMGILLKGARVFRFEKIDHYLTEKSHETVLEVHLNRLVDNLNFYRSKLSEGVKIMAMVKAFGYGAGLYEISSLLQFHKINYLAVAYADEGMALRRSGIEMPILVLNTEISALDDLLDFNLEPEVYSFRILSALREKVNASTTDEVLPVHIKLETGMHRLGFEKAELPELIEKIKAIPRIRVQTVLSHLAASDDPREADFTRQQIAAFEEMTGILKEGLGYKFDRHILNSSGISNFPQAHFEMVRLGIGLYGVSGSEADRPYLKAVSSLKATVSQLKSLSRGESLGYGRAYIAEKDRTIAVISLGYADGFRRSLSHGVGEVVINKKRYPVVGRVCMDMAMVDVSDGGVQEGDEVEVFGPGISLYELADKMDTIPYEVLASISQRVKRIYLME